MPAIDLGVIRKGKQLGTNAIYQLVIVSLIEVGSPYATSKKGITGEDHRLAFYIESDTSGRVSWDKAYRYGRLSQAQGGMRIYKYISPLKGWKVKTKKPCIHRIALQNLLLIGMQMYRQGEGIHCPL